jgi:hypothetical protein
VSRFIYHYAECFYVECRYAECRGALLAPGYHPKTDLFIILFFPFFLEALLKKQQVFWVTSK